MQILMSVKETSMTQVTDSDEMPLNILPPAP